MTEKNKSESEAIRERINVLAIIRALEDHILNGTEMGATQIKAALVTGNRLVDAEGRAYRITETEQPDRQGAYTVCYLERVV